MKKQQIQCSSRSRILSWSNHNERHVGQNLHGVKHAAVTKLHNDRMNCTLMLLSNLAEPDWISIPCNYKILHCVVCANTISYPHGNHSIMNIFSRKIYLQKISYFGEW